MQALELAQFSDFSQERGDAESLPTFDSKLLLNLPLASVTTLIHHRPSPFPRRAPTSSKLSASSGLKSAGARAVVMVAGSLRRGSLGSKG